MRIYIFLLLFIITFFSIKYFEKNRYDSINDFNISETDEIKELENLLDKWCDDYHLVRPELRVRFNRSNEGYYRTNLISILITKEAFMNNKKTPYLKVILAHEFGHHLFRIKSKNDYDFLTEELEADLISLKLIGYDGIEKVFMKEISFGNRNEDINGLSLINRLSFLRNRSKD